MSVNKFKPHVWVIPEDDADRKLAIGFQLHDAVSVTNLGIASPAGGWPKVLDRFEREFISYLRSYSQSHVVLLIDFDGFDDRRDRFESVIPNDLKSRVFILGSKDEPEDLQRHFRMKLEEIGTELGQECFEGRSELWESEHLRHNHGEVMRMVEIIKPILFEKSR